MQFTVFFSNKCIFLPCEDFLSFAYFPRNVNTNVPAQLSVLLLNLPFGEFVQTFYEIKQGKEIKLLVCSQWQAVT